MIRNVVFDIGNVLIGFEYMNYLNALFDKEKAVRIAHATFRSGYWQELDIARYSVDEILGMFCSVEPDLTSEITEAFYGVGDCVERLDWPIPLIDLLKEKGYGVYFLSNMSEHVIDSNKAAFDFVSHMDGGIWSCDVHTIKPGADIYNILFERYDLVPEECIFIDDNTRNTTTAKKLGMKTIVFTGHDQLIADLYKALTKDAGHDRISVLCYGDSNTYGYDPYTYGRYPYEKRWTTLLGNMLGEKYEVIAEGLNGRTTAFDRPGAVWKNGAGSFIACLSTHKPVDYLIFMLGTNDSNAELGLSAETIAGGMETLVKMAEEESPELQGYIPEIIITVPAAKQGNFSNSPFSDGLTPESVQKSYDIAPLYKDIAERHDAGFVDASTCVEVSPDCVHISEEGHRQLAELLYKTIVNKKLTV